MAGAISALQLDQQRYDNLKKLREQDIIDEEDYNNAKAQLDKQRFEKFTNAAQAAYGVVGGMMNAFSQSVAADAKAEEAAVNKKYAKLLKAAEGNQTKTKALEEQKAKELADIKNKANRKAMSIEMAQAAASAAMAALNAYKATIGIPVVGPVMAPIAAAAAVAFGAQQIANIKKQHEAQEEQGYYEGGYTRGTRYRKKAGVVHEGEFVANHLAVQNPNVRPVLDFIDHAQRNNTIASVTARDIGRVVAPTAAPSSAAASTTTQQAATAQPNAHTEEVLERLTSVLERGIRSTVVIDGQEGVAHQLARYNQLKNRK